MLKLLLLILLTLSAAEGSESCALVLGRSDGPPLELIAGTYRRLLTELKDPFVQGRRIKQFEAMLVQKGWLTPEVRGHLARTASEVQSALPAAQSRVDVAAGDNGQRAYSFQASRFDHDNVSADNRWVFYSRYDSRDRHQLLGNLETGEIFDLGVTDGDWAYLRMGMSAAGDAIGLPWAHGKVELRTHKFSPGQPRFGDFTQQVRTVHWTDAWFGEEIVGTSPHETQAGPAANQWLVRYENPDALYLFDTVKRTGYPLSLRAIRSEAKRLKRYGTIPGTGRIFFVVSASSVTHANARTEVWTAELTPDGTLTAAKKFAEWAGSDYGLELVWGAGGNDLFYFNVHQSAKLTRVSETGTVKVPIESPLGARSKLIGLRADPDGVTLDLLFESEDSKTYQPVRYSLVDRTTSWSVDNRFGPSAHRPFFTGDGKRVVYQRDPFSMESRQLIQP